MIFKGSYSYTLRPGKTFNDVITIPGIKNHKDPRIDQFIAKAHKFQDQPDFKFEFKCSV